MALKCYQYYFIFYSRRIYLEKKTLRTVPCGINGGKAVFRIIFKHFSDLKKKKQKNKPIENAKRETICSRSP